MAWGTKTQIATALSVAATEQFSSWVTHTPGEGSHIQIKADFPASPTDDLIVATEGTLDAATEQASSHQRAEFRVDNANDPAWVDHFVSSFYYKWRLGFRRTGSTDTITVDAWVRSDGISV